MQKTFLFFYLILSFKLLASQEYFYDPKRLKTKKSSWTFTERGVRLPYTDFFYEGKTVFRVLQRLVPLINSIIIEAERTHSYIKRKSKGKTFYNQSAEINRDIMVGPHNKENDLEKIKNEQISFLEAEFIRFLNFFLINF